MSIEKRFPESSNDIMYKILNLLRRRRRALLKEGDTRNIWRVDQLHQIRYMLRFAVRYIYGALPFVR
jgi:hypothetical protein